jgi:hypothetical protein
VESRNKKQADPRRAQPLDAYADARALDLATAAVAVVMAHAPLIVGTGMVRVAVAALRETSEDRQHSNPTEHQPLNTWAHATHDGHA